MSVQPAGNYYDKYHTRNPIARWLVNGFLHSFEELATLQPERVAVEVGCGEGELSMRLAQAGFRVTGYDIAEEAIAEARQRVAQAGLSIPLEVAALGDLSGRVRAPLVVCCEVLEHLDDPQAGLDDLARVTESWLLVSVPREPLWRALNLCRGRYLGALGNTPGHVNHWSTSAFLRFLERRFEVHAVRQPLPWTMALCRRR
ncbi:MAG: class I SAM-dependent methyltransferase [Lysobacterales bacterium]